MIEQQYFGDTFAGLGLWFRVKARISNRVRVRSEFLPYQHMQQPDIISTGRNMRKEE